MNIKKLNKLSKELGTINTGYKIYIGYDEVWKCGRYNNEDTEYYVSSLGRVYNINRNKYVKPFVNGSGYLYCHSYYKGIRTSLLINKLVAESFFGYPKDIINAEADHIDSDKFDNSIYNLQWLSRIDNLNKRILSNQENENNSNVKYTSEFIIKIANLLESGQYTMKEISEKMSIPYSTVNDIKQKVRWKSLLKNFDFSSVPLTKKSHNKYNIEQIKIVADLINENNLSLKEISEISNMTYDMVSLIKHKKVYSNFLSAYDFSHYNAGKVKFTKSQLNKIDKYINEGLNPKDICTLLDIEYTKKNRNSIYDRKRKIKSVKKYCSTTIESIT